MFFSWSLVIYWLYLLLWVTRLFGFLNLFSVSRTPTSSFTLCPLDSLLHSPSVFQFPYLRPGVTICWMNKCLPSSNLCSLGMAVSSVPGVLQNPYDSWHLSRAPCLLPGQHFSFSWLLIFAVMPEFCFSLSQTVWALFWRNSIADRILKRFTVKLKLLFICTWLVTRISTSESTFSYPSVRLLLL